MNAGAKLFLVFLAFLLSAAVVDCSSSGVSSPLQLRQSVTVDKNLHTYQLIALGSFGPTNISDRGIVSGSCHGEAALFFDGKIQFLGLLPGLAKSVANDVNDFGAAVGSAFTPDVAEGQRPVLFADGKVTDLRWPTAPPGQFELNSAQAINNAGLIVGYSGISEGPELVVATKNSFSIITTGAASDVNSSGVWVGYHQFSPSFLDTIAISSLGNVNLPPSANSTGSQATAINDRGDIAGTAPSTSNSSGPFQAFLSTASASVFLGALPGGVDSSALGLNNKDQVVGFSFNGSGQPRAFLYQQGHMLDLTKLVSAPGWILNYAYSINNSGEIVGQGNKGGFLLEPE